MTSLRLAFGIFLITLIAAPSGTLWGQTPAPATSPPQVRALLESPNPMDQAWGALMAAQGKTREVEPELRKNLESHSNPRTIQDQLVLDTTLDAFIQFGEDSLPFELLQSLYLKKPEQALILLAEPQRPRAQVDAFMLNVLQQEEGRPGLKWFAAADLLSSHRAPGLVSAILRNLRITGSVVVCDSAENCSRASPPGGIAGSNLGTPLDSGFPPWPVYTLVKPGVEPARLPITVFIKGVYAATTMAYSRNLETERTHWSYPAWDIRARVRVPTTADRIAYIAAAAPGVSISIKDDEKIEILWKDRKDYSGRLDQFRANLLQRYSAMIRQLRDAGLLTVDEAAELARPPLDIVVDDRRKERPPL